MAHLHGGRMVLASTLGEGTKVSVFLPVGQAAAPAADDSAHAQEAGLQAAARAAVNPLEDYTRTPDLLTGFGDFVIRPPKS
jgi:cell cycle sensor histidine kinase DivJ